MIGQFVSALVAIIVIVLVATSIYPIINEQIQNVTTNPSLNNSTPLLKTTLSFFPIIFVVVILFSVLGLIFNTFRSFSDYSEDYDEKYADVDEENKPHKQTYLEYAQERLKVEKLLRRK